MARNTDDMAIDNAFIRESFQWDRMSEVNWDLLRNNLKAAEHVLLNPGDYPRADFAVIDKRAAELTLFLALENFA